MNNRYVVSLIACFRATRLIFHLLFAILLACIYPALGRNAQRRAIKSWSLDLLAILNVSRHVDVRYPLPIGQGCLLVANHISWLDGFSLCAEVPAYFVAKVEVRAWPFFGWLCRRAGTLFIHRELRRDTSRINLSITAMLRQGERIALFPEGTSTDGAGQVYFHSSLLQGAIDSAAPVYPVAIRYHDGCGNRLDDAAFIGDMTLLQSLWKVLCSPALHVSLICLPAVHDAGKNRRALALEAQQAVNAALVSAAASTSVACDGERHAVSPELPLYALLLSPFVKLGNHLRR